jgi:hypothetical protein
VPGVDQIDLEPAGVEDVVERQPIHAGRLQRDGGHPTLLEPIGEPMEIGRKTLKSTHGMRIAVGPDGDVMDAVADVNARGVRMDEVESGTRGPESARERVALFAVQSGRTWGGHAGAPLVSATHGRPGCDGCRSLSNGVTVGINDNRPATRSAIARTGAMLLNGQKRASRQSRP